MDHAQRFPTPSMHHEVLQTLAFGVREALAHGPHPHCCAASPAGSGGEQRTIGAVAPQMQVVSARPRGAD
eukprot:2980634-Lingulodinium_polyedra.AAC.1